MIEQLFAVGFIGTILFMGVVAMHRMDLMFIVEHPLDFFMELMFVAIVPALLMVFVFARTRKFTGKQTIGWTLALSFKLMLFHILAQLCGLYTYAFS